jgi:acyl-coenzyme A synthetase/AMP-(fatty) acid ligase
MNLLCPHFPQRPALVLDGGEVLSYSDLQQAVDGFKSHWQPGELVFLLLDNDLSSMVGYLSALAGGAVPLLLGGGMPEHALHALIDRYQPESLLVPATRMASLVGFDAVASHGDYRLVRRQPAASPKPCPMHPSLALLLATSGSTGAPKLVRLSARNVQSNAESIAQYLQLDECDRAITTLPFNYSYGLSVINSHLSAGASVLLTRLGLFDAKFWPLLKQHQVTRFQGVPFTYEMLLKLRLERLDWAGVRSMTVAGGRLAPDKVLKVHQTCQARGIDFYVMYGQTEATARMAFLPPALAGLKPGSIGRAIPGGKLDVLDEHGQDVSEAGQLGELIYRGPNVCLGYAQSRADLALGDVNQGVLRTGDLARFDADGCFYIEGRLRRFLKIHGVRVSLAAVEQLLEQRGLTAAAWGVDDRLCVSVQAPDTSALQPLQDELAGLLNVHRSTLSLQAHAELPRLESGKIDYPRLVGAI